MDGVCSDTIVINKKDTILILQSRVVILSSTSLPVRYMILYEFFQKKRVFQKTSFREHKTLFLNILTKLSLFHTNLIIIKVSPCMFNIRFVLGASKRGMYDYDEKNCFSS